MPEHIELLEEFKFLHELKNKTGKLSPDKNKRMFILRERLNDELLIYKVSQLDK